MGNFENNGGVYTKGEPSEEHIGQVGGHSDVVDLTLVLDTTQYASGDVLAITAITPNVARVNGGKAFPFAIQVVDEDDQGQALDLLFFRSLVGIGTINQAFLDRRCRVAGFPGLGCSGCH